MHDVYTRAFPIPEVDIQAVAPIMIVIVTGILALLVEILRPKRNNNPIVAVSVIGLLTAAAALIIQFGNEREAFAGMVLVDRFGSVMQLLVVFACLLCILFSEGYLRQKRIAFGEFYPLILWSSAGAMLMATSRNLLVIFLGLEVLSIALYVMAGMSRSEEKSEESAVKYFLLGAFASGFLLYGIAFMYGASGSLRIDDIALTWSTGNHQAQALLIFGLALILVGLCFKSAFVPFHQWTPDVYQGAPTNVTAFMAAGSKIAAIAALFRVLEASGGMIDYWLPALSVVAVLTMTVGNLVALLQKDVKRILGYSSIAHAGYILVAILAHTRSVSASGIYGAIGSATTTYYLLSYSVMTIGAFAVISLVAKSGKERTSLDDLHGLYRRNPIAAGLLVIFMASLIGIPPTSGFIGKLLIFNDALQAKLGWLAIILAINSVISIAYYLAIARAAFVAEDGADQAEARQSRMGSGVLTTTAICAISVFAVAFMTSPLMTWMGGETAVTQDNVEAKTLPHNAVSAVQPKAINQKVVAYKLPPAARFGR
jgi:NADH-quinone oxidoreductase subunit N